MPGVPLGGWPPEHPNFGDFENCDSLNAPREHFSGAFEPFWSDRNPWKMTAFEENSIKLLAM